VITERLVTHTPVDAFELIDAVAHQSGAVYGIFGFS
jgi:hypothetical protein